MTRRKNKCSIQPFIAVQRGEFRSSFWRILCALWPVGGEIRISVAPARTGAAAAARTPAQSSFLSHSQLPGSVRLPTCTQPQAARAETPQENKKKSAAKFRIKIRFVLLLRDVTRCLSPILSSPSPCSRERIYKIKGPGYNKGTGLRWGGKCLALAQVGFLFLGSGFLLALLL